MKPLSAIVIFLVSPSVLTAQTTIVHCTQKERKNDEGQDPILVKTCFYKNFKFISTAYPDYAGRYIYYEREVYVRVNNKYIKTTNDKVFNKTQSKLVTLVNKRIREDFNTFSSDTSTKNCFTEVDSLPTYKMNDFEISFEGNEIWFEVHWGLSGACRAVDGTIVAFKLNEIRKYLN